MPGANAVANSKASIHSFCSMYSHHLAMFGLNMLETDTQCRQVLLGRSHRESVS